MKKTVSCILLLFFAAAALCGCAPTGNVTDGDDPIPYVSFLSSDTLNTVPSSAESVSATLNNVSGNSITTGEDFTVFAEQNDTSDVIFAGKAERGVLAPHTAREIVFPLGGAVLTSGTIYRVALAVSYTASGGDEISGSVSFFFRCLDVQTPDVSERILTVPIAEQTAEEQEQLAQYLFRVYIPCSYGIFENVASLSSSSLWSSVEALNAAVDEDSSEVSRTLAEVMKKMDIYYPGANFDPAQVRTYDPETQSFVPSGGMLAEEYVFLSYTVEGDEMTIFYEDVPDAGGEEPLRYRTTLKNSATEGYFSFVSSLRVNAIG